MPFPAAALRAMDLVQPAAAPLAGKGQQRRSMIGAALGRSVSDKGEGFLGRMSRRISAAGIQSASSRPATGGVRTLEDTAGDDSATTQLV